MGTGNQKHVKRVDAYEQQALARKVMYLQRRKTSAAYFYAMGVKAAMQWVLSAEDEDKPMRDLSIQESEVA